MRALPVKVLSMLLVAFLAVTIVGVSNVAAVEGYPMEVEELGSGDIKWTEVDTPDGWTKVENEGGATLGYSKDSRLQIIQVDGYAFKDLNHNGQLDVYEDWRLDYRVRAEAAVDEWTTEEMMGLKMNPFGIGSADANALADQTKDALNNGYRHIRFPGGTTPREVVVGWNSLLQEHIENMDVVIPATFIADPLGGSGVSNWPGYLGIAASFDPELAAEQGRLLSEEWRALGISMKVAPQIDLATDPRWKRADMTFGEDPQLSVDMSVAIINAWQSSYDEDGNDLGWGPHSVNTQMKHFPGDGADEGGRESHTHDAGYTVFPGGQFTTHMMPFLAALDLPGKTESASAAMTNFSIAIDADGSAIGGERTATSFNKFKLNTILRGKYGFDGYILTDFGIINDGGKTFGVEHLTPAERELAILEAGADGFGGEGGNVEEAIEKAMEAYQLGVDKLGQEGMDEIMRESTRRTLTTFFNVGVVDNPYLNLEKANAVPTYEEEAFAAQVRSIVMLKNEGNIIDEATDDKLTVYIPWKYTPETQSRRGVTPASITPVVDLNVARQYFNVVTDRRAATLTGPEDDAGNPTVSENDIVRASAEDLADVDLAIVRIQSPQNGNPTRSAGQEDYTYRPISLQYRPYSAFGPYVRFDSIAGDIIAREVEGVYGMETVYEQENRSYFGETAIITNESDLDLVLTTASLVDKVVVAADIQNAMIFSEFEDQVDAIVVAWGGDRASLIDDAAFLEVISGQQEPSGLLPMQMPKDMDTVEAQFEDVPRDMEPYVDSAGNAYDFAFGMNWAGVIQDERTEKYDVPPLVGEPLSL